MFVINHCGLITATHKAGLRMAKRLGMTANDCNLIYKHNTFFLYFR